MSVATPLIPLEMSALRCAPSDDAVTNLAQVKDWWIEIAANPAELSAHQLAWETLARECLEPNVFCEPWMFLPALETFRPDQPLSNVFVYRRDPRPKQRPQLCGFFPLEEHSRFRGLPIRTLRLRGHHYSFLGTPLVHRDWAAPTLHALFDWIAAERRASLLKLPQIHGEGPFHQALIDVLNERNMLAFVDESYTRALLRRGTDAESYCTAAMNHLSRKEWRRQRRRLSEQGKLETRVLGADGDVHAWIEQFLRLEASGWKGNEQTAMAMNDVDRAYFRTVALRGFERRQVQMLGIFFNDQPIALKCNFLSGDGGFAFKIAFDEAFAKTSPGVQLELDNIDELHRRTDLRWMDSCAEAGHFMINRLWKDRRTIQSLIVATSRWTGQAVVGMLPLLRSLQRMIVPKK